MGLRRLFMTAGAVWALPLAISATVALFAIAVTNERFIRDNVSSEYAPLFIAVCALAGFAGSIFLGNHYGKRFARKEPPSWAANVGAMLVVLGVVVNVAIMVGYVNLMSFVEANAIFENSEEEMPGEFLGK